MGGGKGQFYPFAPGVFQTTVAVHLFGVEFLM